MKNQIHAIFSTFYWFVTFQFSTCWFPVQTNLKIIINTTKHKLSNIEHSIFFLPNIFFPHSVNCFLNSRKCSIVRCSTISVSKCSNLHENSNIIPYSAVCVVLSQFNAAILQFMHSVMIYFVTNIYSCDHYFFSIIQKEDVIL